MSDETEQLSALVRGAIRFEEFGMRFYDTLALGLEDYRANSLFRFLSLEEEAHRDQLRGMLEGLDAGSEEEVDLHPEEGFFETADELKTDDPISVLESAIRLEKRLMDTYGRGMSLAREHNSRTVFEELVRFERGHSEILQKNLDLMRDRGIWYGHLLHDGKR